MMSRSFAGSATVAALLLAGTASTLRAEDIQADTAVLGWLDKVTARVGQVRVPVGQELTLGSLTIVARSCVRRVPPDDPESGAFLDISERLEGQDPREVFHGWMYASSPALSAMDHGVYDVWVLNCEIPADLEAGDGKAESVAPSEPVDPNAPPLD
jgi:hypothetical protein